MLTVTFEDRETGEKLVADDIVAIDTPFMQFNNNGNAPIILTFADGSEMDLGKGYIIVDFTAESRKSVANEILSKYQKIVKKMLLNGDSAIAIYNLLCDQPSLYQHWIMKLNEELFGGYESPKVLRNLIEEEIDKWQEKNKDIVYKLVNKVSVKLGEKIQELLPEDYSLVECDGAFRITFVAENAKVTMKPAEYFNI